MANYGKWGRMDSTPLPSPHQYDNVTIYMLNFVKLGEINLKLLYGQKFTKYIV